MHQTTQAHHTPQRVPGCCRHKQQHHQTKSTLLQTAAGHSRASLWHHQAASASLYAKRVLYVRPFAGYNFIVCFLSFLIFLSICVYYNVALIAFRASKFCCASTVNGFSIKLVTSNGSLLSLYKYSVPLCNLMYL